MSQWKAPLRPSEHVENALVEGILDGLFPPGSALPGERTLAARLGVTRPTLREAIQRLARDGWIKVAHGKPTVVNNFWQEGGLNVLGKLVEHGEHLPVNFIGQLLEVRFYLAPAYTRSAVTNAAADVVDILTAAAHLNDEPADYAHYDWLLHHQLTILSGNPIFTLILNGFEGFYENIACRYFASATARAMSARFYADLLEAASAGDAGEAERLCREVMLASIATWEGRDAE